MGNGFVSWFSRSYKGIIVGLVAIMALMLVILAVQHVNESGVAAGAEPREIPTFGTTDNRDAVAFLGDSYTGGSGEDSGKDARYPALIAQHLGLRSVVLADGGAGYTRPGLSGSPLAAQVARIPDEAKLVVVYGSRNDIFTNPDVNAVRSAATDMYEAIKEEAPGAKLLVIGPSYVERPLPVGGKEISDALRGAAMAAGADFVDAANWFQDTPQTDIGKDGVHPTDAGHTYLASKIEPLVTERLN